MDNYRRIEGILYSYTTLKAEIKNIELEIETIINDYRGAGAISYEEKTGPTYKVTSAVENEIVTKEKKIERLKKIKRLKEIDVQKIENALETLTQREKDIIRCRYFEKKSWNKVGEKLDLTGDYCMGLSKGILKEIEKIIIVR